MKLETYSEVNKAWKSTCKVLFGEEIGDLQEYEEWLAEAMQPVLKRKSYVSGNGVYCAATQYPENANFIGLDEIPLEKKPEALNINEIKDIDSIVEALNERFSYCGNIVLANSKFVEKSSDIQNSFYIYNSNFVYEGKNIAFSSYSRGSEQLFAVISDVFSNNCIRVFETHKQSRCFEAWKCYDSSDCYYSSCVEGSQEVLFSFNLKNKRYTIGNIELPKDKYYELKGKLIAEMREELKKNKKLPSLMELVDSSAKLMKLDNVEFQHESKEENIEPIEQGFRKTTKIVLGKELYDFRSYEKWLRNHVPSVDKGKSVVSGKPVYISGISPYNLFLKNRLVRQDECWEIGECTKLEDGDITSFQKIKDSIGKIGFLNPEALVGTKRNTIMTPAVNSSVDCYYCPIASHNEKVAYSYWPRNSKYIYGSNLAFLSNFCINSHYSMKLCRTLEVDSSSNCSDLYFSHHCENVRDAMFCFNVKNLKNAIGNVELGMDDYRKIKKNLLGQIANELEEKKDFKWNIFNLGEQK